MIVNLNTNDPFHLIYANGQNGIGTIVNLDLTNSILVGPDEGSLFPSNPDCFIIGPLNPATVSGAQDYWAIALSGTPQVQYMPNVTFWAPSPIQAAEQTLTIKGSPSQFIWNFGTITPGTAWGPVSNNMQTSGRYLLYLFPTSSSQFATDITITHFDSFTNTILTEEFTVTNAGSQPNTGLLIQGNVLGAGITISGLAASAAWVSAVTGTAGGGSFTARLSLIPLPMAPSEPKIIGIYDGFGEGPTAFTGPGFTQIGTLTPIAGRANLKLESGSGCGPGYLRTQYFTVVGGTSPFIEERVALPTNASNTQSETTIADIAILPFVGVVGIDLTTATGGTIAISIQLYAFN